MNWVFKLFVLIKNIINYFGGNLVNSMVDIRREGYAIINQIDKKINTIQARLVDAQTTVNLNQTEIASITYKKAEMEKVAAIALRRNQEADALEACVRIGLYEKTVESLKLSNSLLTPVINEQLEYTNSLKAERDNLKSEIQRLDIEEKAYKLRGELVGGITGSFKNNIEALRDRVKHAKAAVEAKGMVSSKLDKNDQLLENKYLKEEKETSAQQRLEKIRQKI